MLRVLSFDPVAWGRRVVCVAALAVGVLRWGLGGGGDRCLFCRGRRGGGWLVAPEAGASTGGEVCDGVWGSRVRNMSCSC